MSSKEKKRMSKLYPYHPQLATCMAYRDAATEFWRCAEAYYNLDISDDEFTMSKIAFYLIGLSVELYLKAFIIFAEDTQEGYEKTKKRLRGDKVGHNIAILCIEAGEKGLSVLTEEDRSLICELNNKYYSHSSFRYKQGACIGGEEIANFLEIILFPLSYYFTLMGKIKKEADRTFIAG